MTNESLVGRGSLLAPPNRFERVRVVPDDDAAVPPDEWEADERGLRTEFFVDASKSIVSENDSPDVGFRYSVNPYRGCEHGCAYCYARPTHEYLGLNAGIDFESKVFVKERAPELFREWLARRKREAEVVVFSGVTDCYQPAERRFRLTRRCLEVALEARQPVAIITKNALVVRDLDVLAKMAESRLVCVSISVTTLDASLARSLEPRTSPPRSRLEAIRKLSAAGVPTRAMLAPIIPGLNDSEIPALLKAVAEAGAETAHYVLLRLPLSVRPVFQEWLARERPEARSRVESRIRSARGGELNDPRFGTRMKGEGPLAEQIARTFHVFARRHGLGEQTTALDASQFRRPTGPAGQGWLF
ncbi:MAG: PA0069 family radical SAM protein [Planctomycetaceae bacterium]